MKFSFLVYILFLMILVIVKNNESYFYGAYAIREYEDIKWLNIENYLYLKKDSKKKKANFYIKKCINEKGDNNFYFINTFINNTKLCLNEDNLLIEKCEKENNDDISKWLIIKKERTKEGYIIQNKKSQKYIGLNSINDDNLFQNNLTVKSDKNNATIFILYKIYEEHIPKETELLKKEPIDILIKYIDLKDPTLKRDNIKQIKKDEDNDELKYCLRSIIENLPWIRKIFILMPNEKVKFLKNQKKIKEKIIFVKDKDLIGFESASIYVFQFNLWKMKKFGMSENFILMDDDYFINYPLNKSDFFYEENNQIFPLMITNDYYLMNERKIRMQHRYNKAILDKNNTQSEEAFLFRQLSSLKFMFKIFEEDKSRNKSPLIEASFSHNAIPLKLNDIKEVYDLVLQKYKYIKETLYSIDRNIFSLHFQTLILSYVINKYKRKVHGISCAYIDINNYNLYETKYGTKDKLFVINTSDKQYDENVFILEKIFLEKKFPNPTKYELEKGENNDDDEVEHTKNKIKKNNNQNIQIKNDDILRENDKQNKNKKESIRNISYYFLEYFWILILIIIIYNYAIKKIRNTNSGNKGYIRIQQ